MPFVASIPLVRARARRAVGRCKRRRSAAVALAKRDDAEARAEAAEMVRRDLEAMRARPDGGKAQKKGGGALGGVKEVVKTLLVGNFFVVCGILVALVAAVGAHYAGDNTLLDWWLALWKPLFQPILGVLMLGTIVQGTISYVDSK